MNMPTFAARGDCARLDALQRRNLFERAEDNEAERAVVTSTSRLIERVRAEGDAALREFAREYDGASLEELEVPWAIAERALRVLDPALRRALERAASNIAAAHEAFRPAVQEYTTADGVRLTRRPDALERAGVYAPGGRAAYPSSLLMGVIPARVAGVREVIVCSPPGPDGLPSPVVLAASALAGADRFFAVGGAGAIAALAYGTESIPRVDRIVGPGNAFVAEAKRQVARVVGIDSPAGPSELLIIADDTASPDALAVEMLAQAEHDPRAAVVLIATSARIIEAVALALTALLPASPRAGIITSSFASRGALLTASTLDEAIAFANEWAAEHLLVAVADEAKEGVVAALRNCGTIFVGESSSVAFGDYLTGANHVLPTGGAARSFSGLSTSDFVRWTTTQRVDRASAARLAGDVAILADAEGLPAHAAAARAWEGR